MSPEAPKDCQLCPRLVAYREQSRSDNPDWFNGAVPSFGPLTGDNKVRLLIVGLAPGITGANRTGRPFTGDWAGDLLFATLLKTGLATGTYDQRPDDGLQLHNTMITNAVRCVPPQNKPIGAEMAACRPFLQARIKSLPNLKAILCLGRISHDNTLTALDQKRSHFPFSHGAKHSIELEDKTLILTDSYHCSRYNTNTKRLTNEMFEAVFTDILDTL
ncbi:MAG: uracil-DNA glycosylase [bacterium]